MRAFPSGFIFIAKKIKVVDNVSLHNLSLIWQMCVSQIYRKKIIGGTYEISADLLFVEIVHLKIIVKNDFQTAYFDP